MVKGVDIPWIGRGSIYHGKGGQNTMGREGIQYILIIMGRGGNKISKFPKNLNFQKSSKFQNFYKISKKSVYIRGVPLPMVYQPPYPWYFDPLSMVYRPPYPWYISPCTHDISTPTHGIFTRPWYIDPPIHGI